MAQKPEENKKHKQPDNKIREGSGDNSIHSETKQTDRRFYPKPSEKDTQYKDQPEFIDNEPNRKNDPE
jgi:hypothetical protein